MNTIRCCISCILPCGALDVIRIVHANGRVEEISGPSIRAADVLRAHPKHVLKKPSSSSSSDGGCCPKILIVPPDAELQRGKIYFLMPVPSASAHEKTSSRSRKKKRTGTQNNASNKSTTTNHHRDSNNSSTNNNNISVTASLLISDRYLSEILSEKISTQRDRRRGRAGVWRPHLESISETPIEA
ncbi:Protein of unknown function DUF4228, plant protein [Actinidia chinensis var. chinensis]|uniref:Uncharacterized protein n=1 Tax=Actinidia chinensis var. chinensis TaxID=1590841 RepID=A0A2R6Q6V9_ACTCC|nr:Protein of unknown function DUF4228, plant protein [Actinidia chinensis var. chinensis]